MGLSLSLPAVKNHFRQFAIFYLALCCAVFTVVVFYPGYMSPDSLEQMRQARQGVNSNAYPPLMAYVWRVTDKIVPGPGGMLILLNVVFWAALAGIARESIRWLPGQFAFVLVAGFWPPSFCTLGTIWKDVAMQAFLLAAVASIVIARRKRSLGWLAACLMALFAACGFRHNAVAAAIPLIGLAVWQALPLLAERWPRYHAGIASRGLGRLHVCVLTAGAMMTVLGPLNFVNTYGVRDFHLYTAALIHDLSGMSVLQNVDYLPEWSKRRDGVTLDDLKHMYSPMHANALYIAGSRPLLQVPDPLPVKTVDYQATAEQARQLTNHWMRVVLDNPGTYAAHRWPLLERLLVLIPRQPWYPFLNGIDPNPYGLVFHHTPLNTAVMDLIVYAAFSTWLFSAWIYYAVVLACGAASFLWKFAHARLVQALALSVALYFVSVAVFGMSGDFRYNIWAITCGYICPVLLAAKRPEA